MLTSSAERNPVEQLAEEFAERIRRGERPALSEYTDKYPQWADEIRDLFPALVMMEQFKPKPGEATGDYAVVDGQRPPLDRLGDYRILREVGRGGMGIVYEAEQESLGRHVALKVLPPHGLLDPTFLERFRREARAAAKLHHTNIVPVYGVGECEGVHFYAMQFIRGEGLDKVLHDLRRLRQARDPAADHATLTETRADGSVAGRLLTGRFGLGPAVPNDAPQPAESQQAAVSSTWMELMPSSGLSSGGSGANYHGGVARIGLQVADALAYAHRQGILHRDVKPSNLLLDTQGIVWITDFGLAKEACPGCPASPGCQAGESDLTHTGDIVGTVRFMAPERFDGQSLPQSDVYGLGVTLYELLTLRPAFDDTNKARLVERVLHEPPVLPRKIEPGVPRDLETIVLKCLAKEPVERYATADLLAEDLRRFVSDRPVLARRSSALEHLQRWCRRNPVVATLSGAVALLLLTLTIVSTLAAMRLAERRADLQEQLGQTLQAKREGQEKLVQARLAQARAARFSGQVGQRFDSLDAFTEAARIARELGLSEERLLELRNEAVACMVLADLRRPSFAYHCSVTAHDGFWFDDAFENYAVALEGIPVGNGQGQVSIRRLTDDRELVAIPGSGIPVESVRFSPDGRSVVVTDHYRRERQGSCQFWNLATGKKTLQLPSGLLCFTPDGRRVWVCLPSESAELELYDLASSRIEQRFTMAPGWHYWALHPDGRQIAECAGQQSGVRIWDTATGKVTRTLPVQSRGGVVAWHPGGRLLAVSAAEHTIETWSVERNRRQAVLRGHKDRVTAVVFNSAGDLLASVGWDAILRLWDPMTGKLLLSKEGGARPPQFSRDGRLLGSTYSGSQWEIWEVTSGGAQCRTLAGSPDAGQVVSADFGRSGQLLAWSSNNGVGLWDLGKNRQLAFPDIGEVNHLLFDRPDGSLITCGRRGLERWPVVSAPHEGPKNDSPPQLQIGPPQLLHPPGRVRQFDMSADGRRLVVSDVERASAFILDPRDPAAKVVLSQPHLAHVAISPDGRWVATGTYWGGHTAVVKVWDAGSGACVRDLEVGGDTVVVFSPDGCWLATDKGSEICLWRVGTWERDRVIARVDAAGPSGVAFSPDGRVLAFGRTPSLVQLLALDTLKPLASLAVPDPLRVFSLRFSADGSQLVAGRENQECHVWDLRAIRKQLAEMGLDWNAPPYSEAPEAPLAPLEVRVVGAKLVGRNPTQLNNQAWLLANGPAEKRDPAKALKLIQEALEQLPDDALFLNTLGVVQYRNGLFKEAVATLEKSLAAGKGHNDAFDLFFLAMCHAKLGDPAKAKDCFDRAVKWMEGRKDLPALYVEELQAFRAEAADVLAKP